MKKGFITILLTLAFVSSAIPVFAENKATEDAKEATSSVELVLSADNPEMLLNGEAIEITPPKVTENGVTLVPVRVITEAFGADVSWDDTDKSIHVLYREVDLTLTIGSKSAVINGFAQELESAPEIIGETTLVPLRFIAETFGADIDYNPETGQILVTLTKGKEAQMLQGMHDKDYVGDSSLNWSMKTPRNMHLDEASNDGKRVSFSTDLLVGIDIFITKSQDKLNAENIFQKEIRSHSTLSLVKRNTDAYGNTVLIFEDNSADYAKYTRIIVTDHILYTIYISTFNPDNEDENVTKEYEDAVTLVGSFSVGVKENMYDFSKIKEGFRDYKNEEFKLSVTLPQRYKDVPLNNSFALAFFEESEYDITSEDEQNLGYIYMDIHSKSKEITKESLADKQYKIDTDVYNPDITTFTEITPATINDGEGLYFDTIVKGSDFSALSRKFFFEVGDYVYRIEVYNASEEELARISESLMLEPLDSKSIGTILYRRDLMGPYTYVMEDITFTLPKYWVNDYDTFKDDRSGAYLVIMSGDDLYQDANTDAEAMEIVELLLEEDGTSVVVPAKVIKTPLGKYVTATLKEEIKNGPDTYVVLDGHIVVNKIIATMYVSSELYYGGISEMDAKAIIKSATRKSEDE